MESTFPVNKFIILQFTLITIPHILTTMILERYKRLPSQIAKMHGSHKANRASSNFSSLLAYDNSCLHITLL